MTKEQSQPKTVEVPAESSPKPTGKEQLANRLKQDMGPVAAHTFREARNGAYGSPDWIDAASQEVVNVIVDRVFDILHDIATNAMAQDKKAKVTGGEVKKDG